MLHEAFAQTAAFKALECYQLAVLPDIAASAVSLGMVGKNDPILDEENNDKLDQRTPRHADCKHSQQVASPKRSK